MLTLRSLWRGMELSPESDFLVAPEGAMTYGEFGRLVSRVLASFDAERLRPGDRVMIITESEPLATASFVAALLDGMTPVMLAPNVPAPRASAVAASVEPALAVVDSGRVDEEWLSAARVVVDPQRDDAELPAARRAPRFPEADDELGYILFTSGTTKSPSGVMLSRANVLANLTTISRLFGYDARSRIFNDMILAHGDGLVQGPLLALANRCALIRSGGYTVSGAEDWLRRVKQQRATHVITVPTVWALIDRYSARDDYFDAPDCQALISVAARLDPNLWSRLETRFGRPVFNQYGLTETVASALYAGPHPLMGGLGGVGRPVDCEARLDSKGELLLRGANVFRGYYRDPERTAEAFTSDGWFRTGDLARQLPDGAYDIVGRIKSAINSGGVLIRPEEIDEAMATHPSVIESVTVGLPDSTFGEIAVTAVVLDSLASEAELTAHARARLEPLKVPKRIISVDEIGRGDAGKPLLERLRSSLQARLAEEDRPRRECAIESEVCELAAGVFRVERSTLSADSASSSVAGWDSFSHVALIFAVEKHFGVDIPLARAMSVVTLGDVIAFVEEARSPARARRSS